MSQLTAYHLVSPPLDTNVWLVADEPAAKVAVIDPSFSADAICERCADAGWTIETIVLTHGHIDHIHDAAALRRTTGAPIVIHPDAAGALTSAYESGAELLGFDHDPVEPDRLVGEGESIAVGEGQVRVMHLPGHAPGSIVLVADDFCVVGDLLFRDGVGRWDLPGGNQATLIASLRRLCGELAPATRILPGHGPATTLERERSQNPFLAQWLTD